MLVDSTIYIDLLRRGEDILYLLKPSLLSGQLFVCGVIRMEVLRGIRSMGIRDELSDLFDLMTEVPTDTRIWREATNLAWTLDRRGAVLPLPDLVLPIFALPFATPIVTTDPHFSRIPGLKVKKSL